MSWEEQLRGVGTALASAARVALVSHTRPDGDAIGSVLALGDALSAIGVDVVMVNEDGVPDALAFLAGSERIMRPAEITAGPPVDVLAILDTGAADRAGEATLERFRDHGALVNIDHHASNAGYGDLTLIDVDSPATGQIVFQLIDAMGWPLTPVARDALFCAISTDTGSFRFPNTTAETYRIGSRLLEAGADVGTLSQKLYESYPMRRLELLRELMQDLEIRDDSRVALFRLPRAVSERLQLAATDTEGLIDILRAIDSVLVAIFFEELEDGKIRVSVRSKTRDIDVGAICAGFGGGGHQLAAGTRMPGSLDDAVERFSQEVSKAIHEHD